VAVECSGPIRSHRALRSRPHGDGSQCPCGLTADARPLTSRVSGWAARSAVGAGRDVGTGRITDARGLSDSSAVPIARKGAPLSGPVNGRERPSREAGPRYSAGRAPRGCGRSIHQGAVRRHARERAHAASRRRARGKRALHRQSNHVRRTLAVRPARACGKQIKQPNVIPVAAGIGANGRRGFKLIQ